MTDFREEEQDARDEDRASRKYRQALSRHPDCRDPDHPGCERCIFPLEPEDEECAECGKLIDDCICDDFNGIEETEE